ncbi:MAG: hypothetical protein H0V43_06245, partial [Gemmatimonadales bacterium]|nr:hypothetical protein [Gemmatimonadales bacterium]
MQSLAKTSVTKAKKWFKQTRDSAGRWSSKAVSAAKVVGKALKSGSIKAFNNIKKFGQKMAAGYGGYVYLLTPSACHLHMRKVTNPPKVIQITYRGFRFQLHVRKEELLARHLQQVQRRVQAGLRMQNRPVLSLHRPEHQAAQVLGFHRRFRSLPLQARSSAWWPWPWWQPRWWPWRWWQPR